MTWKMVHLEAEAVLETVYSGSIDAPQLRKAILENAAAAKERGVGRFLSDCRLLEEGASLTDVYDLPAIYESLGVGRDWWEAIVLPVMPTAEEQLKFYETVTRNRGFQVRIFGSREEALAWLTEREPGGGPG